MIVHYIVQPWAVFDATLVGWQDSHQANYAYLDEIPVMSDGTSRRRWRGAAAIFPLFRLGGRRFVHNQPLPAHVRL